MQDGSRTAGQDRLLQSVQAGPDNLRDQGSVPGVEAGNLHQDRVRGAVGEEGGALHRHPLRPASRLRDGAGEGVLPRAESVLPDGSRSLRPGLRCLCRPAGRFQAGGRETRTGGSQAARQPDHLNGQSESITAWS